MHIKNNEPFKEWFRCIPPPLLEEVRASLWDMPETGVICPSQSSWCNAVVLVRKKDGTLCFCVEFRCLNMWMKKDLYPLPCIQEALESMAGSAHFSSMDFRSGFWQIKMASKSQQYTAFTVGNLRFYEWVNTAIAQERFWWSMMAEDCRMIVRGCPHCQAFEGEVPKAPLCPIRAYAPLELVHLDYTSIESTMELNKPLMVKNVLVITDHFMRYALVVVMKDQTAKTVMKVFYKPFIAVFGVPVKLLNDRGVNFTFALVEELCAAFGIQKCQTTAYHAQCNGQVGHFHQTLFHMIGKLARDKKAQWEQHMPELLQAYNSTQSAVTVVLLHYLMFGRCPCLPVDYYFPTASAFEHSHHIPTHTSPMEVRRHFKEAYAEVHLQMNCKAEKQKWYYDRTMSTVQLVPGDVVLMKNDAYQGKQKVKDQWSETEYVVVCQVADGVPTYEVKDKAGNIKTIHHNQLFLVATPVEAVMSLGTGTPLLEENITQSTLVEFTSLEIESDSPEGSVDGADTLSPASKVPLGWVGGVLWPLPSVALRLTIWRGLGTGDGVWSQSDKEVH